MNPFALFRPTRGLIRGMTRREYDRKLATLRSLSAELGLPTMPDLHIGIKVVDRRGRVLVDRHEQGHSWTRNAWTLFNQWMMDSPSNLAAFNTLDTSFRRGYLTLRGTGGTFVGSVSSPAAFRSGVYAANTGIQGALSGGTVGIQVGTSTEPFSGEDFILWGLIAQGTGSGQLSHQAQPTPTVAWDNTAATYTTTYSRVFNNNSSGSITVNEVGIADANSYLWSRDVLASPVPVPVGAQLTITVSITTAAFTALEASCGAVPAAAGANYGGGVYIGYCQQWANSTTNGGLLNSHTKYALILAPKVGGEVASKKFYDSGSAQTISPADYYYGKTNSDAILAYGALSSLGVACAAANTAVLGGYSDWYIPSQAEMVAIQQRYASIPGAEQPASSAYWTSTWNSTTTSYTVNPVTGATVTNQGTSTALTARFVRRIKL